MGADLPGHAEAHPGVADEVLENVGHALFVDDADRFNSLLDAFLKALH